MELVNIASNQLVKVVNNQLVTDSRQVAEAFGKRHRDVMRAIETLWGGYAQNCAHPTDVL